MNAIISALVGSVVTGLIGWVIMAARNRRKDKGDRIGDLRLDVNQRFVEHREDMNRRFDKSCDEMNQRFAEHREDMNRRFDEQKADSERRFAAIIDEIKGVEHRLTGMFQVLDSKFTGMFQAMDEKTTSHFGVQGQRIDGIYDVLLRHGERLTRIEVKLDIDPPAEAA